MDLPKIFRREPTSVKVEKGKTYAWCTCGLSEKNPLCDGHHKTIEGTAFNNLKFTAEEDGEVLLCNCKRSGNPPFCDGTHRQLCSL
jgi:CDGSH-type Zn-finger protein